MFRSMRFILAWLAVFGTALAQADPPARVGRLALVENEVNFRVDRSDAGGPASINWPISSGAEVDTERRGRAEIWIGSTAFRLAGSSELRFPVVDDRQISAQLLRGTLTVSILEREQSDEVTVQTPEGRVSFAGPGRYRIDVQGDHSELTSQAGRASFDDGERRQLVEAGEKASSYGGGRMQIENDEGPDAFDRWVAARENAALAKAGPRHVSPAMTGYQDLDAYGDWQSQPDYGAVWYPRAVADDWAPYRFGRWVWIAPWGWTWVDRAPWGFAPFHYGRWVQVRGRWGWVPGSYVARPVYAPALVAWIGNPGWSVSFSFGSAPAVGWFPLAPREVYIPGFRASPTYVRQINVTHIHDVTIIDRAVRNGPPRAYAYRDQPRAVTVVPARNFREGRPITPRELGRHDQRELARAPQARAVPDSTWLPRPTHEERREVPGGRANEGRPSRDGAPLMRPPANERLPDGRRDDPQRIEMQQREAQQKQDIQRRDAEQQEGRRRDQQRMEMQQREVQQKQEVERRDAEQQEGRRRDQLRMEMQQREVQQKQEMQRRDAEQQEGRRRDQQRIEMQQREAQQRQEMQRREVEQQEARHRDQQRTEMQQREAQQKQEMQRRDAEQQEGRRRDQQRIEMQQREAQQKQEIQRRDVEQQEGRRREQQRMEMQQREAQQRQEIQRRDAEQQEGRRRDQQRMEMQQREAQQKQEMQRRDAEQQEGRRREQQRMEVQQRETQQRQEMQRQEQRPPESRGGNREGGERGPR